MPPLFASLEWQGWRKTKEPLKHWQPRGRKRGATGFLHAGDSASAGFCWLLVCGFHRPGKVTASCSWPGEATAYSSAISTSKGLGGGGSCSFYFCSEATFQDDVVAVTALGCKRETLGIFQEERHAAAASGITEGMVGGNHRSPAVNTGSHHRIRLHGAKCADKSRDINTCFCTCLC